jgi:hypothetical protein
LPYIHVLRAPLGARELASISAEDQLDNARMPVLLEEAARYVDDDREGRYWLSHDRIRQFVRDTLGDDMREYDERAREFALRWNDTTATKGSAGLRPAERRRAPAGRCRLVRVGKARSRSR